MTVRACRVLGGTLCALALALASPSVGAAAMINVTNQLDEQTSGNGCSLREAISSANADTTGPGGDCTAGSGADTIVLPASANHYLVTGADAGGSPQVNVYDATTGQLRASFHAFLPTFTGGVRVALGDVNGDGTPDVIAGQSRNGSKVVAISGTDFKTVLRPKYMADTYARLGWKIPAAPPFLPADWKGVVGRPPYPKYGLGGMGPQPFPAPGDPDSRTLPSGSRFAPPPVDNFRDRG